MKRTAFVLAAALDACGGSGTTRSLTLATFNAANGADGGTWCTADMRARQAALLEGLAADVIALQECDFCTPRVGGADIAAEIVPAGGTILRGMTAADEVRGYYGIALWVGPRLRVLRSDTVRLPDDDSEVWPPYPPQHRVAIFADVVALDGTIYGIAATHLAVGGDHPALVRMGQLRAIRDRGPDILMGDLNAPQGEVWPSVEPLISAVPPLSVDVAMVVDQIWSNLPLSGRLVRTNGASDHQHAAVAYLDGRP